MKNTLMSAGLAGLFGKDVGLFKRQALRLVVARDAAEVLSTCKKQRIDLIILEYETPGMAAEELCRAIKKLSVPPILMMVIEPALGEAAARARGSGCDQVVAAPVEAEMLLAEAARFLGVAPREGLRILTRLRVEFSSQAWPTANLVLGSMLDISASGFRIESKTKLNAGDVVSAEFFLPGQDQVCHVLARVVRANGDAKQGFSYGMQFSGYQEHAVAMIRNFIVERLRDSTG